MARANRVARARTSRGDAVSYRHPASRLRRRGHVLRAVRFPYHVDPVAGTSRGGHLGPTLLRPESVTPSARSNPFLVVLSALLVLDPRLHTFRENTLVYIPLVLLYVSNWVFTFMPASTPLPLGLVGMTWSLAIEEQYYLAWPFLLGLMIRRWSLRVVAMGLLCAAAAEVVLRFFVQLSGEASWRPMTMTFTDSDGLLIGSALAVLYSAGAVRRVPTAVRTIGAAVLVITLLLAPGGGPWNGIGILIGELATVALICSVLSSEDHRVLESRPLGWIGERSYAMYLWHLTVIAVLQTYITAGTFRDIYITALTFLVTFVLADLSYRL